jgi:hypothetical protein
MRISTLLHILLFFEFVVIKIAASLCQSYYCMYNADCKLETDITICVTSPAIKDTSGTITASAICSTISQA